jgi:hypothetical protein
MSRFRLALNSSASSALALSVAVANFFLIYRILLTACWPSVFYILILIKHLVNYTRSMVSHLRGDTHNFEMRSLLGD